MSSHNSDKQLTKAEIGFEPFPCGPCAEEADRHLRSLNGVIQILFDPAVQRVAVPFDPGKVNIPVILSFLEPFTQRPRVISMISPMKGVFDGQDYNLNSLFMTQLRFGKLPMTVIRQFFKNWGRFSLEVNGLNAVSYYLHLPFFVRHYDLLAPFCAKVADELISPKPPGHVLVLLKTGEAMGHGPFNRVVLERILEEGKVESRAGYSMEYCALTMIDLHAQMKRAAMENPYP